MSSKINLQTCEYARKSSIFQDNQLIWHKYAKEINAYRTERLLGAGALRDYDFRCLPDEILKSLDGYPSFKRYCYTNGMLYAQIKIDDSFFTIPPIRDEKQMDC